MAVADLQSPIRPAVKALCGPVRGRYKRPFDLAVLALAFVGLLPLWILLALVVPWRSGWIRRVRFCTASPAWGAGGRCSGS